MSAKWTDEAWRTPELERCRPPAQWRYQAGAVVAWVGIPAVVWGGTLAYLFGWPW